MSTCAQPADMEALATPLCPLCGRPNQCAAARTGRLDEPCWCRDVKIDPQALARIPAEERNRSCLCPQCAAGKPPEPR